MSQPPATAAARPPAPVAPPDQDVGTRAVQRLAGLAAPAGALGRLGDAAVWLAATQGRVPPDPPEQVRLVVFAGDHGVAGHGVSAYPASITPAMVRTIVAGRAGVSALAAAYAVHVRCLDLAVDADLAADTAMPAEVTSVKVCRGSGPIHLTDALTPGQVEQALEVGRVVARQEVAAGAQLLIPGDLGIGNTTPAAALVAALLDVPAAEVVGRGSGVDDATVAHKIDVVQSALDRAGARAPDDADALTMLTRLGGADLAATVGFLAEAAAARAPVLLDGVVAAACALVAERLAPGAAAWFAAGHRSPEPAQQRALDALGLGPLLDLGMRLGEGSGAVAAVPLLRGAARLLRDVALLAELDFGPDA